MVVLLVMVVMSALRYRADPDTGQPTQVPGTAPLRGNGHDAGQKLDEPDPVSVLTRTWNLTGYPAVSVPAGVGRQSGLPVGVSLVAPRDREATVIQIAIDLQEHALPVPCAPL